MVLKLHHNTARQAIWGKPTLAPFSCLLRVANYWAMGHMGLWGWQFGHDDRMPHFSGNDTIVADEDQKIRP